MLLLKILHKNKEIVKIQNFTVISQYKRPGGVTIFKNNDCTSIILPRMDVLACHSQLMFSASEADVVANTPISDIIVDIIAFFFNILYTWWFTVNKW